MASEAVAAFVVTPKLKEALSGVAFAVPLPDTVIVVVDGLAAPPLLGCATPAIAAATSSTPEMRRTYRSLVMP